MATVDVEQVNARSLRAHGLVDPASSVAEAIVAAAGVYGTAPTSHLGLVTRVAGYSPAELERQRLEERSIVRVPGPRGSVFLAPRELVPAFIGLSRPRTARRVLLNDGMTADDLERLMARIESALAGDSLGARELRQRLGADDPGGPRMTLLLRTMVGEGRAVAAEPIGGERATAYRYATMAAWAPTIGPPLPSDEALAVMAPIWMRANGPGTIDDLAWWAGVRRELARAAMTEMGARPIVVGGLDGEQHATDEVIEAMASASAVGIVRFLPRWDAWLMARRERGRLLDDAIRPWVVDRNGNVTNTITLDGRVVGTWDLDGERLLAWLPAGPVDGLDAAAGAIRPVAPWTTLELVTDAAPLDEGGQNAFRAPLRVRT